MKILFIILSFLIFSLHADEGKLRKIISESYPDLQIKKITKTNYNDLYEIFLGDQIVYSDESFSFLIIDNIGYIMKGNGESNAIERWKKIR